MTLKTGQMLQNTALVTGINYIKKYYNRKRLFEFVIIFHIINVFTVF